MLGNGGELTVRAILFLFILQLCMYLKGQRPMVIFSHPILFPAVLSPTHPTGPLVAVAWLPLEQGTASSVEFGWLPCDGGLCLSMVPLAIVRIACSKMQYE